MFGKGALFLVMGFSLIFLVLGQNFGRVSTSSVDNLSDYYNESVAHNIAVSGANMGANQVYLDPTWTAGISNKSFSGGTLNVNLQILDAFKNIRKIVSIGTFRGYTDTVEVTLQPSKFSKFAYYSVYEPSGIWWTDGDTVWGPFHTQDYLHVEGHPVFNGKVSTKKGIDRYYNKYYDNPIINGTYEQGVDLPLPTSSISDLEVAAKSGGHFFTPTDTIYFNFKGDSLTYKYKYKGKDSTVALSQIAPNGVLFAKNALLRVQGTVKGQYTIVASGNGMGMGNIYIDNDLVYQTDPRTNSSSTDLLGIVAEKNILVSNTPANQHDVHIDGAIYSQTGGFGAEDYDTRPNSGTIYLYGGITQYTRQPVGTFNKWGIQSGFNKNYHYDDRLMFSSPPSFPNTGSFEIVSWRE